MPSLLDSVTTIEDTQPYPKILIYGDPGVGKTHFAGFAPKPLVFDYERSTETYRGIPELASTVKIYRNPSWANLNKLTDEAIASPDIDTLVFDTVSRMQVHHTREYVEPLALKDSQRDKDIPYLHDYRKVTNMMDRYFEKLQAAPINVIFIAHQRTEMEELTKKVTIRPDLTPELGRLLTGLINVVGYLEVTSGPTGVKRNLYVNPTGRIVAKNRLNITDKVIENPTFNGVFNK